MTTCACGCGTETSGTTFCHGHNRCGTKRSPETLAKVRSTWAERHDEWSAGIRAGTTTAEARANYSKAKKGKPLSPEHRAKISEANKGKRRIPGVTYKSDGRALAYVSWHPNADEDGRVLRARLVVEHKIGRYMTSDELAHHINFDVTDDHPDNLVPMLRWTHRAFHHRMRKLGIEDHFRDWFSKAEREIQILTT